MRRYLLDTTPLAALLNNRPAVLALLSAWLAARELANNLRCACGVLYDFAWSYSRLCVMHTGGRHA